MLFYELLKNCLQYRKPATNAEVEINTTIVQQNRFQFTPGKYDYRNYCRIEVTDHGTGFNSQYKEQVFELFKKLHHSERAGLGLAFCKKIMDNHEGRIEVDSKEGVGTTIRLFFPEGDL